MGRGAPAGGGEETPVTDPLSIIFAGSGAFGVPTYDRLANAGHRIVRVYTQPDRPAGRGKQVTPTPLGAHADRVGIPAVRTADINAEALPPADVMVVIAFGQKIGPAVVAHPRLGSVNLHASILPKYRGAAPINWAMLGGDPVTGNSVIRLAERMDAGAVLGQSQLTIGESETAGELHDRLAVDGAPLVLRVLAELAAGTALEVEQDHAAATAAPKLSRQTAVIDWARPAAEVVRRINGLSPWPGCRVRLLDGDRVTAVATLLRARPGGPTAAGPGVLVGGGIAAGDGRVVELLEVKPQGGRELTPAEYRNGRPWRDGMRAAAAD